MSNPASIVALAGVMTILPDKRKKQQERRKKRSRRKSLVAIAIDRLIGSDL